MADVFQLPFVQRGVLEVLLLAAGAGVLGCWIVLRGLAFFAHAVGTATFPGLVLADGLGFGATLGAAGTGAVMAALVAGLAGLGTRRPSRARQDADAATALVLVGALAAGIILASDVFGSGADVESLLFGSLLLVDRGDIVLAAAASLVVLAAAALLGPRWGLRGFDPETAGALGARSPLPDAVLLGLVTLLSLAALSTLGALLSTAILVVPAATTRLLGLRLGPWQLATTALVAAEGVGGLWLSVEVNAPPGPAIAVLGGGVFAAVAVGRELVRAVRPPAALAEAVA